MKRFRVVLALLALWTVPALIGALQGWFAVRAAGREASFLGLLAGQLPGWYAWALFTPLVVWLASRWPPSRKPDLWLLPHALAAVGLAVARVALELLMLLPAEGLPLNARTFVRGLGANLPYGFLLDLVVYALVVAAGTLLVRPEVDREAEARPEPLERIAVRVGGRTVFVDVDSIDWVEAADYYACLHVGEQRYLLRESLKRLEGRLATRNFLRVHRSAIVNLERVRAIEPHGRGGAIATLANGSTVRVSRTHVGPLRSAMGRGRAAERARA